MNSAELLGSLTSVATDLLIDSGDVLPTGVDGVRPGIVVRPATATAAATVLRFASANRLAVVPMGGGSSLDLGNRPDRVDILLDLRELNRVIDYQPQDLTVRVEAGMTLGALQDTLAANKQMLALDPPLMERVTIGGLIAANRSGPRRLRFGTARDVLIGSRALLADGTFVRSGGKVV